MDAAVVRFEHLADKITTKVHTLHEQMALWRGVAVLLASLLAAAVLLFYHVYRRIKMRSAKAAREREERIVEWLRMHNEQLALAQDIARKREMADIHERQAATDEAISELREQQAALSLQQQGNSDITTTKSLFSAAERFGQRLAVFLQS
ncbi:unnamed protein product [Vitrella brassicaformis CCMP3155]|uniref:Uncharacterized protein n=1 Tax=Vitrella brassicaformis (strain CCMP3155) TaxID=1169540 RepID=A0A0G4EFV2_VITBC|nr:unnamed protein product [Vitrella brassicaformis CCMP3155]|eukprot:CEL94314.1 unnamed protein product [Vitrella brassicaformis CCMP3155]